MRLTIKRKVKVEIDVLSDKPNQTHYRALQFIQRKCLINHGKINMSSKWITSLFKSVVLVTAALVTPLRRWLYRGHRLYGSGKPIPNADKTLIKVFSLRTRFLLQI